ELDGGDPLATGLDHVLRAVGDLDGSAAVGGGDVPRAQPACIELLVARLVLEVARGDPRSAHLDLSRRVPVPGHLAAVVAHQPQLHPRQRTALAGPLVPIAIVVRALAREGEIGRASCRERGEMWGVGAAVLTLRR